MREKGWSREFADPIDLPRGRQLVTLEDAGTSPNFQRPNTPRDAGLDAHRARRADVARQDRRHGGAAPA
jgi:hypothetical protein